MSTEVYYWSPGYGYILQFFAPYILSKSLRSLRNSQISGRQRSFRCFITGRLITPRRPREYFEGVKRDTVVEANGLNLFQLCFTPTRFLSFSPIFHSTKFLTFTTFFHCFYLFIFVCRVYNYRHCSSIVFLCIIVKYVKCSFWVHGVHWDEAARVRSLVES